jgi:hypothetical protein
VQEVSRGVYETSRARRAGFEALREVYGEVDPAVSAAMRGVQRAFKALGPDGRVAADSALPGASATAPSGPKGHKQQ